MKKLFLIVMLTVAFVCANGCAVAQTWRKDVSITLQEIHTDAAFKQFKKASKQNQLEILTELLRQANKSYTNCKTINEIYDLRESVVLIERYLASGKQSFMSIQKDYNLLYNRINKTIRVHEGGTTIYHETGGYRDFGQELN